MLQQEQATHPYTNFWFFFFFLEELKKASKRMTCHKRYKIQKKVSVPWGTYTKWTAKLAFASSPLRREGCISDLGLDMDTNS